MAAEPARRGPGVIKRLVPSWRREAIRTTLWVVPAAMVVAAIGLFAITYQLDSQVAAGDYADSRGWAILRQVRMPLARC